MTEERALQQLSMEINERLEAGQKASEDETAGNEALASRWAQLILARQLLNELRWRVEAEGGDWVKSCCRMWPDKEARRRINRLMKAARGLQPARHFDFRREDTLATPRANRRQASGANPQHSL
jgi:hypothetical protein